MNPVVHFEIPVKDAKRAQDFYANSFGWTFSNYPLPDGKNYISAMTCEYDEKTHMPLKPGQISGGFTENDPAGMPVLVLSVENVEAALKKAEDNGAEVVMPVTKIGDFGLYGRVKDTEGNIIGLWQDVKKPE